MSYLLELHQAINKLAPIEGISLGDEIRVDFAPGATQEQQDLVSSNLPNLILVAAKKTKISALSKDCEAAICSGFVSNALGSPHHYNGQIDNQINLAGVGSAGLPVPYRCTDLETGVKSPKVHTGDQIFQVFQDGVNHKLGKFQKFNQLEELVNSLNTVEEVEAVVWDA